MSKTKCIDITGNIGPLWQNPSPPKWPMYSYEGPAYLLWNAIANGLNERGWTEKEIKTWLQSKEPRWALDQDLGDSICTLGTEYSKMLKKVV